MSAFLLRHAQQLVRQDLNEGHITAACRAAIAQAQVQHGGNIDDYACTLVALIITDNHVVSVHIGDGLVAELQQKGVTTLSLPENGTSKCTTYFVTGEDAAAHTRIAVRQHDPNTTGFAVMSDGAGDVLFERKTKKLSPVLDTMSAWLGTCSEAEAEQGVRDAITQHFLSRTHDDCSLILVRRLPSEPAECPVCGRLDLVQEPLRDCRSFLRCPACGFSYMDEQARGKRYPYLLRQWVRYLFRQERMPVSRISRLTCVPPLTLARWLIGDQRNLDSKEEVA